MRYRIYCNRLRLRTTAKPSRLFRLARALGVLSLAVAGGVVATSYYVDMSLPLVVEHMMRFTRTSYVVLILISFLWFWFFEGAYLSHPFRKTEIVIILSSEVRSQGGLIAYDYWKNTNLEIRSEVHLRSAKRLLELCQTNRGTFVKAGQHIASMNQGIPKEYVQTLSVLQDKAQPQEFEKVRAVIENELGRPLEEFFSEFDRQSIAAASLAQVHRARLKNGQEVAVKVQYGDIYDMFRGDMMTMSFVTNALAYFFPQFTFTWVLPEFRDALESELDFRIEAQNAEKTASQFKHDPHVAVPKIYHVRFLSLRSIYHELDWSHN